MQTTSDKYTNDSLITSWSAVNKATEEARNEGYKKGKEDAIDEILISLNTQNNPLRERVLVCITDTFKQLRRDLAAYIFAEIESVDCSSTVCLLSISEHDWQRIKDIDWGEHQCNTR